MLKCLLLTAALALGQAGIPADQQPAAPDGAAAPVNSVAPAPVVGASHWAANAADDENIPALPVTINIPSLAPAAPAAPAPPAKDYRRALPSPFGPPLPGTEYQGYPIIGTPPDTTRWPLMKELQGTPVQDWFDSLRIREYGWITWEANWSTSSKSNAPFSYWIRPNTVDMDQAIFRFERQEDTVQTDHIDWGFRSTFLYGIDYRYMTSGGWFSDQLLKHNDLYGFDPTEQYIDVYVPWIAQGFVLRVGRWIACPDIETQFAPDNYMGSHSILFTFDTYTQTGLMGTWKLSDQWTAQAAVFPGTDMAPWYKGAILTGACGLRWVAKSNNDAIYTWLNAINSSDFQHFYEDGQPAGHDNFNYWVATWEHKFDNMVSTKTEAYLMWQHNAVVGGTVSIGPPEPFFQSVGIGAPIPGYTYTFGVLNYTEIILSHRDYITIRNEWWRDTDGERSGFAGVYTSHAIGLSHNFTDWLQIRPEIGFYRNWDQPAFNNGTRQNQFLCAFDFTWRF